MFGGRMYDVTWDAKTAVTASVDIFEIVPADDKPVVILELRAWQTSDYGDANDQGKQMSIRRKYSTSGSGGSAAPVIEPRHDGTGAASFTAECRNTTLATGGTPEIVPIGAWNLRQEYLWTPTQPDSIIIVTQPYVTWVWRLDDAPGTSIDMNAYMLVEEIG